MLLLVYGLHVSAPPLGNSLYKFTSSLEGGSARFYVGPDPLLRICPFKFLEVINHERYVLEFSPKYHKGYSCSESSKQKSKCRMFSSAIIFNLLKTITQGLREKFIKQTLPASQIISTRVD